MSLYKDKTLSEEGFYIIGNNWSEIFFSHINKFWTFNNETLDLITHYLFSFDKISWKFSKRDTDYILKKLKEMEIDDNMCKILLRNYDKFTFNKWNDWLDLMVDFLYENFASKTIIKDFLDIINEEKKGKTPDYKLTIRNIKILKILEKQGSLFTPEGDKIASILMDSWKYDNGLKRLISQHCRTANIGDPKCDLYISKGMVERINNYFAAKRK